MGNKTSLNKLFSKRVIAASTPDSFWPLPGEFIGLEIEVESIRGNYETLFPEWDTHSDASLRNGIEFVTSGPVSGQELTHAISKFFNSGLRYSMSPRTSIHIHINASDNMTVDHLRNVFSLMYVIEPAVFRWADEDRKWCGYCSPLTDIGPDRLLRVLASNDDMSLVEAISGSHNSDRYYGLNLAAVARHGTLEFRYFPCTDDEATLISWVKFVMYVKKAASGFDETQDLLSVLSNETAIRSFLSTHFPDVSRQLINALDFSDAVCRVKDLEAALTTDSRRLSDRAYSRTNSPGFLQFVTKNFPTFMSVFAGDRESTARAIANDAAYEELARNADSVARQLFTVGTSAPPSLRDTLMRTPRPEVSYSEAAPVQFRVFEDLFVPESTEPSTNTPRARRPRRS